jgi:thioredoxin reductase (NADPH)
MYDVIIIGAGPAGLVSGLYAGRYRLKTLILEKMSVGGQIILSSTIENFPGFPGGITTIELIEKFKKQVDELGVPIVTEEVIEIVPDMSAGGPAYTVKTPENSYKTSCVIIASGANPKKLGVPGEDTFIGRGVSYCGTCDAPFFRNKDILIVGGGDRALEEALYLTNYANKVTLVHRRKLFRGSEILGEKVMRDPKINFMFDSVIEEVLGKERVEAVKIKNVISGAITTYVCQGVFVFVGIKPNTGFVRNLLHLDDSDFIITNLDMKASLDGMYACGDCCKKSLYQVVNACGEGAVAADSVHKYVLTQILH